MSTQSQLSSVDEQTNESAPGATGAQGGRSDKGQSSSSRRTRKSDGAFRTISEVADELDVQQHVLRFWETKFSQVKPLKRGGGRRYYRPEDVELLKTIHHLLYTEGYTIKGVQKMLREQGKNKVVQENHPEQVVEPEAPALVATKPAAVPSAHSAGLSAQSRNVLEQTLAELKELRDLITAE